jgi:glycosyltransferase involved in cell wall biosynthesis
VTPLRVVSVQTTSEPGGAEYAGVDLLAGLGRWDMSPVLLTNMPEVASGSGVPTRAVELGPKLSRRTVRRVALGFPIWLARLARGLRRERVERGTVDVLLVHYKKEQLMAALLPRRLVRTVVWAEWGPLPNEFRRGLPRRLYALASRRAALVLAISGGTKRSLVDAGVAPEKIHVVPNAVDVDGTAFDPGARERLRAEWGAGEETFVAGCVGRFHPKKRTAVLLRAMEHLDGDVLLVLAGEGEDEPALRGLAEKSNARVLFLPTPRGTAAQLLSAFDLALFAPAPTEGSPHSVVMAQLTGRAVVATDRPGAEDLLVPGTGAIADPPQDPRAVAALIEEYRRDPDRREREGAAARRHAETRYDRRRIEQTIARLIGEAVEAAGLP